MEIFLKGCFELKISNFVYFFKTLLFLNQFISYAIFCDPVISFYIFYKTFETNKAVWFTWEDFY
jgi:hypothetical protein